MPFLREMVYIDREASCKEAISIVKLDCFVAKNASRKCDIREAVYTDRASILPALNEVWGKEAILPFI